MKKPITPKIVSGIDIVDIARFARIADTSGPNFLERIFLPSERIDRAPHHLAGFFAAKEAVVKAFSFDHEVWHNIEIVTDLSGRPDVNIFLPLPYSVLSSSISITHANGNALAVFVALLTPRDPSYDE